MGTVSISEFKERIGRHQGFAKANRFEVDFSGVNAVTEFSSNWIQNVSDLNIMCDNVTLPGRTTSTFDFTAWRNPIKIPNGYAEEDIEMSFLLTNDYFVKDMLEYWSNLVIDRDTYLLNYDYRGDFTISQLNENNERVHTTHVIGGFPYTIKGITLDNAEGDTITKLGVTFAYQRFTTNDEDRSK